MIFFRAVYSTHPSTPPMPLPPPPLPRHRVLAHTSRRHPTNRPAHGYNSFLSAFGRPTHLTVSSTFKGGGSLSREHTRTPTSWFCLKRAHEQTTKPAQIRLAASNTPHASKPYPYILGRRCHAGRLPLLLPTTYMHATLCCFCLVKNPVSGLG